MIFGDFPSAQNSKHENNALDNTSLRKIQNRKITLWIIQTTTTTTMQGFDEFCDDDNDDAGVAPHPPANVPPVIGVGAGASVASAGAASLGLQFRQTRRTFKELMEGEVIAHKQDRGAKGLKTYIAIRKSATMPLPHKLLGPRFLGAKNKEGEVLNRNKSIQDDYLSNLQALKPIINQMAHYDMKGVLNVPSVYDDTGLTFEDCWGFTNPCSPWLTPPRIGIKSPCPTARIGSET